MSSTEKKEQEKKSANARLLEQVADEAKHTHPGLARDIKESSKEEYGGVDPFMNREMEEAKASATRFDQRITLPTIYFWADQKDAQLVAAFKMWGKVWGLAYPVEENRVRNSINTRKLVDNVKRTMDVLVHHGKGVLDRSGNIDMNKLQDMERRRWNHDPLWGQRIAAFEKAVKFQMITREKAVELGYI